MRNLEWWNCFKCQAQVWETVKKSLSTVTTWPMIMTNWGFLQVATSTLHGQGPDALGRLRGCLPATRLSWAISVILPSITRQIRSKIAKGEYVSFDKLLIPKAFYQPGRESSRAKQKHHMQPGRIVHNLASWLEAWNWYIGVVLALQPDRSLELINYQTLICAADACTEYVNLWVPFTKFYNTLSHLCGRSSRHTAT